MSQSTHVTTDPEGLPPVEKEDGKFPRSLKTETREFRRRNEPVEFEAPGNILTLLLDRKFTIKNIQKYFYNHYYCTTTTTTFHPLRSSSTSSTKGRQITSTEGSFNVTSKSVKCVFVCVRSGIRGKFFQKERQ